MRTTDEIRGAFQRCFDSDDGQIVLETLKEFAAMEDNQFITDARRADFYAGRRSVITEIQNNMKEKKK